MHAADKAWGSPRACCVGKPESRLRPQSAQRGGETVRSCEPNTGQLNRVSDLGSAEQYPVTVPDFGRNQRPREAFHLEPAREHKRSIPDEMPPRPEPPRM